MNRPACALAFGVRAGRVGERLMYLTTATRLSSHLRWEIEPDRYRPGFFSVLLYDECNGPEQRSVNLFCFSDMTPADIERLGDGLLLGLRTVTDKAPADAELVGV